MKNQRFRSIAAATLATMLLASCSSEFPTDDASCRGYGDTIWDKCWWFNNAGWFGFGIAATIYGLGWKLIYESDQKGKSGAAPLGMLYLFVGTAVILFGGSLGLTMLFEKMLTNP